MNTCCKTWKQQIRYVVFSLVFCASFILFSTPAGAQNAPNSTSQNPNNVPVAPQYILANPPAAMAAPISEPPAGPVEKELTETEQKIFGYATFTSKNLDFAPNNNMATPQNYIVGPADQLIIQVYGVAQETFLANVSAEGKVSITTIGLIHVGGFTIEAVTALLKQRLAERFSGLTGPQPNTFVSVTLGKLRTIKVNIVGELNNPGTYTLPSYSSVFNALYMAGGPTEKGTFRNIQVFRLGKLVAEVDIYKYLTKGEESGNVRLSDNDVILVRPIETRIELVGEVRTPGLFEVKKGETFADILNYSGGFNNRAYEGLVHVRRNTDAQRKIESIFSADFGSFEPADGDLYTITKIQDRYLNRVQISGTVVRPGEYELTESLTLKQLVEKAGGLLGDAFYPRATLYRTTQDFNLEAISVDVKNIMNGSAADILLQNEDVIHFPSKYDVREELFVQISGEVNTTGVFSYAEDLTVGDLILKAGGFKESASNSTIEIARRVSDDSSGKIAEIIKVSIPKSLEISDADKNLVLLPFDHVFVRRSIGYKEQKLVSIDGEINFPGTYALETATMRISDLIARGGGMNQFAYPRGATLLRRTEFYDEPSPDEVVAENLKSLQDRTKRDGIENSVSEQLLLDRIGDKIDRVDEEIAKQEEIEQSEFRADIITNIGETKAPVKNTELIGIDLESILAEPGSKFDLFLQEGDLIFVPKELQTVRLRGEVLYPTTTRYDDQRSFRSYVTSAGGFSDEANKKKSYVIYANGDVKRTKSFLGIKFYPNVDPGSDIIVPMAEKREEVSVADFVGISTSLITLYLLINTRVIGN